MSEIIIYDDGNVELKTTIENLDFKDFLNKLIKSSFLDIIKK